MAGHCIRLPGPLASDLVFNGNLCMVEHSKANRYIICLCTTKESWDKL